MNVDFKKYNSNKENMISILKSWDSESGSKSKQQSKFKNLKFALSIIEQSILSLKEQKHGFLWVAKNEEKDCAILIGDEGKDEFVIRFLVSNVKDSTARGSGTFLVEKMKEIACKSNKTIRTTPENSDYYWRNKMGFELDEENKLDCIFNPNPSKDISTQNKKNNLSVKNKKKNLLNKKNK